MDPFSLGNSEEEVVIGNSGGPHYEKRELVNREESCSRGQALDYYICNLTVDRMWVRSGATVNLKIADRLS